jgi:hypothetical protein
VKVCDAEAIQLQTGQLLEIAVVALVEAVIIELTDRRIDFVNNGQSIGNPGHDCVVSATDHHRLAWKSKRRRFASSAL